MTLAVWNGTAADESSGDLTVLVSPTVTVTDKATGAKPSLFSDRAGNTGIGNPFTAGADGSIEFYVAPGRYKVVADDGSGNTATWDDQLIGIGGTEAVTRNVASLTDMQALSAGEYATVYMRGRTTVGDGGEGHFRWDSSNLSTEVGNDEVTTGEGDGGIYVAPSSDKTGASGAWVRMAKKTVSDKWYGTKGSGSGNDDYPSFNAAITSAEARLSAGKAIELEIDELYHLDTGLTLSEQNWYFGVPGGTLQGTNIDVNSDITPLTVSGARAGIEGIKFSGPGSGSHSNDGLLLSDKFHTVRNVRAEEFQNGFHATDIVTSLWERLAAANNNTGFRIDTAATTLTANSCWDNGSILGWVIDTNSISTYNSCAADNNTNAWTIRNSNNLVFNGCSAEKASTEAITIQNGCHNLQFNDFASIQNGNDPNGHAGAVIDILDGTGTTEDITIDGIVGTGDSTNKPDNMFNINCTGPVYIRRFKQGSTPPFDGNMFENADGLGEYKTTYTTSINMTTSGSVTLSGDQLTVIRRGKHITAFGRITVDSVSSPAGDTEIVLPYSVATAVENEVAVTILPHAVPYSGDGVVGQILGNSNKIRLKSPSNNATPDSVQLDADSRMWIYVSYYTNEGYTFDANLSVANIELLE